MGERREGSKRGRELKGRGNLAPTVISKSRRLWLPVDRRACVGVMAVTGANTTVDKPAAAI